MLNHEQQTPPEVKNRGRLADHGRKVFPQGKFMCAGCGDAWSCPCMNSPFNNGSNLMNGSKLPRGPVDLIGKAFWSLPL